HESLLEILKKSGSISEGELKNLKSFFGEVANIKRSQAVSGDMDAALVEGANAMEVLFQRISGARLGAKLGEGAPGSSLLLAGVGSTYMRQIFDKIPIAKTTEILKKAALDGGPFMALLLQKPKTQMEAFKWMRQMNAYIVANGWSSAPEIPVMEGEE
ncbi:MAG: hypothetical protein KAI73_12000, partial [Rhodospirillaceae bacterium]|nr:hypothetical protein [Rhodospirillaceae bacterium]